MSNQETDRLGVMTNVLGKELTVKEAAEQLGLSTRQVKRLKKRLKKHGAQGLIHRGRGKPSNRKLPVSVVKEITDVIKKYYPDFGPTLAAEQLLKKHEIIVSKETIRTIMAKHHLWKTNVRKKNRQHRAWRPRKENYGSMQQYDGCYHRWFEGRAEEACLLLAVDDATGKITHAWFDHHEGVLPTFNFWRAYVEKNGKPTTVYLDKFSTYKINHKAAEDNHDLVTQFQRACLDLGITLITAHSPEAKGRVERMFKTLQDRLVKELRLAGISDIDAGNIFLAEKFIPAFNDAFSVVPEQPTDLHRPLTTVDQKNMNSIFSIHSERIIMNDFTIQFKNQYFQLNQQQPTLVCRKDTILVEEHTDETIELKLRGKKLSYLLLPKRPEKVTALKIVALTSGKPTYKPPANHPWRKQYVMDKLDRQKVTG